MITDPWFYAAAIPAVIIMGLAKSGFLAGFGSLATPLMAMATTVPKAAAVMLPLLMVMDMAGVQQLWRDRDAKLFKRLLLPSLVGVGLGGLLFSLVSTHVVAGLTGLMALAFVAHRRWMARRGRDRAEPSHTTGRLLATVAGFTSFVVHAGGPPMMAYTLRLAITPLQLAATMSVLFAFVNAAKVLPYMSLGLFDKTLLTTSAVLLPLAPLSVWAGVWLTRRIDAKRFHQLAELGLLCAGAKLLYDALT
jgi:uncharacterized protein